MLGLLLFVVMGLTPSVGTGAIDDTKVRLARLQNLSLHPDPAQLEWVTSQLQTEDVGLQRAALRAIGFFRDPKAVPVVLPFLQSPSNDVQVSALFACARMRALDAELIKEVADRSSDPYVKLAVQSLSARADDRNGVRRLEAVLQGSDLKAASIVSAGLAMLGEESGMAAVLSLLASPLDEKRNIAAQACLDAPYRAEWLRAIAGALDTETYSYVTAGMVQALISMGRHDIDHLARELASSSKAPDILAALKEDACFSSVQTALLRQFRSGLEVRQSAELFKGFDDALVRKTMREIVNDAEKGGKNLPLVVAELGRLKDWASVDPIRRLLKRGSDARTRGQAAVALAQLKDSASIPLIVDMLGDPESESRKCALQASAIMRVLQAMPAVELLLQDQDREVAAEAKKTMEILKKKEATLLDGVSWLGHDGFMIKGPNKIVYIDPYQIPGGLPMADIILITHDHSDHLSCDDIAKIATAATVVFLPDAAKVNGVLPGRQVRIKAGEVNNETGITIRALEAYNLKKQYHPPQYGGLGYHFTAGGVTFYHAGDTDLIPEMKEFPPADVCFLPVSGTYVMTAKEAAEATKILKCKKAIPMHYGSIVGTDKDAEEFKRLASCPVEILPISAPR